MGRTGWEFVIMICTLIAMMTFLGGEGKLHNHDSAVGFWSEDETLYYFYVSEQWQGNDILMALYLRQLCAYVIADSSGVSYEESQLNAE